MPACPRCGRENEPDIRFCGRCGLDIHEYAQHHERRDNADQETKFCYKHPKEATNLTCGRCDKPLCTKCVILGPAGPRCKECAKHNIEFRPGAVVLGAKRSVVGLGRLGPWGIYILIMAIVMLGGFVRSCSFQSPSPRSAPTDSAPLDSSERE